MNTSFPLLLCAAAVAALAGAALRAADLPPPPTSGKVLVLDNEHTLEGDIARVGDQYRVRRPSGAETWLPAAKALRLCASLEDAYAYLQGRTNLRDPDERLRLAEWCHLHGLRQQALDEVTAAVALRPEHAPSQRLLARLQQIAAAAPSAPAPTGAEADPPEPPPVELSAEAMCVFSTKVQPILMNACATCHATGKGGAFKLTRAYDDVGVSRRTVQQNVAAVLGQVNLERPPGSPLLTKAVTAHGSLTKAPLQGQQAAAFRTLEDWVRLTVEGNPQLREPARPTAAALPTEPTPAKALPTAAPVGPLDPFDPIIFNRQMHPEKK